MSSPAGAQRSFRTDIQALRALAVTAVLLYHLWPEWVPGGYVGVDVFFVVSGFLITGLLARELESTGRINLLAFYARRLRRLLPAALLVLAATFAMLMLFLPSVLWPGNLAQISGACAYLLNWVLAAFQTDYLAADTTPSLVQHYWSLSLEEQFYAVWPILLIVVVALSRVLHIGRRAAVGVALGVLLVVSFWLSVRMTAGQPEVAFFLPHVRAWEFALGGLVAVVPLRRASPLAARLARKVGLVAVVFSCLAFSHATAFPGWIAAVPTAGTALAIAAGTVALPAPGRTVTSSVVQWVGDHSYSIYLWHWPPIVGLPWILHRPLGLGDKAAILVATLALAWWTKKYVEDPIRTGHSTDRHHAPTFALAVSGALAVVLMSDLTLRHVDDLRRHEAALAMQSLARERPCFGAAAMTEPGCDTSFAAPGEPTIAFAGSDYFAGLNTCQLAADEGPWPRWCTFGKKRDQRSTVALVGNSFAGQLVPMVQEWAAGRQTRILLAARTDCLGLTATPVPGQAADDQCLSWSRRVLDRLLRIDDLSLVVFATHLRSAEFLTGQDDPDRSTVLQAHSRVTTSLLRFADAGIATAVVKHPPGPWPMAVPLCLAASQDAYDPCVVPRRHMTASDPLAGFAARHPGLTRFISLDKYVCDELFCHATVGDVVAYFDDRHLSTTFARTLAGPLAERLDGAIAGAVRRPPPPRGS